MIINKQWRKEAIILILLLFAGGNTQVTKNYFIISPYCTKAKRKEINKITLTCLNISQIQHKRNCLSIKMTHFRMGPERFISQLV